MTTIATNAVAESGAIRETPPGAGIPARVAIRPLRPIRPIACGAKIARIALLQCLTMVSAIAGEALALPKRVPDSATGSALAERIKDVPVAKREAIIADEVLAGNVPQFLRALCPVELRGTVSGKESTVTIQVTPDYLAVGSDDDYLLVPLRPATAQKLADRLGCLLPTPRMVDAIWASAPLKLAPHPLPPGPAMTSMDVMAEHNRVVGKQRSDARAAHPFGTLTAGHKKDVVLSVALARAPGKVAIYGWHRLDGTAIQPLYLGHTAEWVDYSHGIRLISQKVMLDGAAGHLGEALANPKWSALLSPEGPIHSASSVKNSR